MYINSCRAYINASMCYIEERYCTALIKLGPGKKYNNFYVKYRKNKVHNALTLSAP